VVAAVLVAGSEKAAAHRLGLSHSTVKHHLANARSEQLIYRGRAEGWLVVPSLEPSLSDIAHPSTSVSGEQRQ